MKNYMLRRGTFLRDSASPDSDGAREAQLFNRGTRLRAIHTIGVVFSYASEIDVMQTAILRGNAMAFVRTA